MKRHTLLITWYLMRSELGRVIEKGYISTEANKLFDRLEKVRAKRKSIEYETV